MKFWKLLFSTLILATVTVVLAAFYFPDSRLHFIACEVGQGDAILITKERNQILIDGGPSEQKVLACLSRHLPFWDRTIEMVVLTHPERDHYGGLIAVFRNYRVETFLANPIGNSSPDYQVLEKEVGGKGITVVNPIQGQKVRLGMMQLDIVWPSEKFLAENLDVATPPLARGGVNTSSSVLGAFTTSRNLNDFCIASRLTYKNFTAILPCDLQPPVINDVVPRVLAIQPSSHSAIDVVLKVPHHGSKNGLTKEFLDAVNPSVAVISVGKNQWGHPNEEVIKLLSDKVIKILRTDQTGDVEIISEEN